MNLANLEIKVDTSDVKKGVASLDELVSVGGRAESVVDQLGDTASQTGAQVRTASQAAAEYAQNAQLMATQALSGARSFNTMGSSSGLAAHHVQNLTFQLNDVFVGLASGQKPMTVFMQQGAQIAQIMQQAGLGVRGFGAALLSMAGITKTTTDAQLAQAAVTALANRQAIASIVDRTAATIAARQAEIAVISTQLAQATSAEVAAAATEALVAAETKLVAASAEAAAASQALVVANAEVAATSKAAAASTVVSMGAVGATLLAASLVIAGLSLAVAGFTSDINQNSKVHVSWKDTLLGTYDAIAAAIKSGLTRAFSALGIHIDSVFKTIWQAAKQSANLMIASFVVVPEVIIKSWSSFPAAIGELFYGGVNLAIRAVNALVSASIKPINDLITTANMIGAKFGLSGLPTISAPQIASVGNPFAGAGSKLGSVMAGAASAAFGRDYIGGVAKWIEPYAIARALGDKAEEGGKAIGRRAGSAAGKEMADTAAAELAARLQDETDAILKAASEAMAYQTSTATTDKGNEDLAGLFPTVGSKERSAEAIKDAKALNDQMERLKQITGQIDLGSMFGKAGSAIDDMASALDRMSAAHEAYIKILYQDGATSEDISKAKKLDRQAQINGQIALLHGAKNIFNQQSAAYKAIDALEKIQTARALVSTAVNVAAGAAKIFASLGPWAFPVVGAMVAVMAGLGFKGGSSTQVAPASARDLQEQAGTGSVLGDSKGKSNSIENSLEIVASNTNNQLEYSNQMLAALQSIEAGISKLAGNVAQQIGISGSLFDTSKLKLGSSGSGGFLGLFASSTQRELWDAGLKLVGSSVGNIVVKGVEGQTYQIVQQIKKNSGFLGIGGSTKTTYETTTGLIDPSITKAIQNVVISLRSGLIAAADVLGVEGAAAIVDSFRVELGTLSFKDMTGAQIEEQLNAIFSKVGDDMAGAILPPLAEIQKVGEGLFETFTRAAREYQVVDISLRSIGLSFGAVGVASISARDSLVQLFGGLDKFTTATSFYRDNFLSEAQRMAPVMASVAAEMERLNLTSVDTVDKFKSVIDGLDLTSQAGRDLYAALLQVAPAFSSVEKYQQKLADDAAAAAKTASDLATKRYSLEATLLELTGNKASALAIKRRIELAAMDASLQGLQMQIYWAQDVAAARDRLTQAYQRERSALSETADRFSRLSASLRDLRSSLDEQSPSGLSRDRAFSNLSSVGALAAMGNESSANALKGTVDSFLSASRATSGSSIDYQRDLARAAIIVDRAISGTDGLASAAQQQINYLDQSVKGLTNVDDSVVSVEQAIQDLKKLLDSSSSNIAEIQEQAAQEAKDFQQSLLRQVQSLRDEGAGRDLKQIELSMSIDKLLRRFDAVGIIVRNESTDPVYVKVLP